jgi:hypothetical protein
VVLGVDGESELAEGVHTEGYIQRGQVADDVLKVDHVFATLVECL